MSSKLSIHIRDYPDNIWDVVSRMQPSIIKIFDHTSEMNIDTLRRVAKPLVIFRQFTRLNDFQAHSADEFVAELARDGGALSKLAGKGILWEGINEPGIGQDGSENDIARAKALNTWYVRFAELMHKRGEKVVGFSWSTGNPTDRQLRWIIPHITEAAEAVDAHAFHEYAKPRSPKPDSDWGCYRRFEQALPGAARKPVVITEAGIDDLGDAHASGWAAHNISVRDYVNLLAQYDALLAEDEYVLGATIYTLKDHDWPSFEIEGEVLSRLADHVANRGGGAVLGETWQARKLVTSSKGAEPQVSPPVIAKPDVTAHGEAAALTIRVINRRGESVPGAILRLYGNDATLGSDPRAVAASRGAVTWTRPITGHAGSLWNAWQKFVARDVAGITWEEFRLEAPKFNPALRETDRELRTGSTYYFPENRVFADMRGSAPAIVWDRRVVGIEGDLWDCWQQYVQGKVVGLTWDGFRTALVAENPALAATGAFRADQTYRLPRNADQEEYNRLAYATADGEVTFDALVPGDYRLEINADGYRRQVRNVHITGDQTETVTLDRVEFTVARAADGFVGVNGRDFVLDGRPFRFVGVNLRGLAHYGTPKLPNAPLSQQVDQLKEARTIGAKVVRIFLPDADAPTDVIIGRLKRLIGTMNDDSRFRDMYLIVALTNLYKDVRFHVPGDDDSYDSQVGDRLGPAWFAKKGSDRYREFVQKVVTEFKKEPRIMAYDIGNELKTEFRGPDDKIHGDPETLIAFMHEMASLIRQWDERRHLVTTGMISTRHAHMAGRDDLRLKLYKTDDLAFITNHTYHGDDKDETPVEQDNDAASREDDYDVAERLGKPLLIEEAGFKHTEGRRDRTDWFGKELKLAFDDRKTAGYMPWGFMKGGDNGDGDRELGFDDVFHTDWDGLSKMLRKRADDLTA